MIKIDEAADNSDRTEILVIPNPMSIFDRRNEEEIISLFNNSIHNFFAEDYRLGNIVIAKGDINEREK